MTLFKSLCYPLGTSVIAVVFFGATSIKSLAADVFILPEGAGAKDGSNWENARSGTPEDFQNVWSALAPSETLFVGSGTYPEVAISAEKGGEADKPVKIVGVDRGQGLPLFTSKFDKDAANPGKTGAVFFEAMTGASNFELSNLHLKGYNNGILLKGQNSNIKISKMNIENSRECIRSEGGATAENLEKGSHDVDISDCRFINFTKRGIRLQNGNYKWRIERCYADAGGKEWGTEIFPICYHVIGDSEALANRKTGYKPVLIDHHIEFIDCAAMNAYCESTKKGSSGDKAYWNGDGFCVENDCHDISYNRCVSMHHTDGGWDDKSVAPVYKDCVAMDNKRNIRIHKGTGAKMINCLTGFSFKRGGSGPASEIWTDGSIDVINSTIISNGSLPVEIMYGNSPDAKLTFKDSIFVIKGNAELPKSEQVKLVDSVIQKDDDPATDVGISATKDTGWKELVKTYDSSKYGDSKGFSSTRWGK